jgi:Flp pilus assembly protein TadG
MHIGAGKRVATRAPRSRAARSFADSRIGRRSGRSGQSLILVALMMTSIMGFAALVIDVGFFESLKRQMQTAADAAAIAAAKELSSGNSSDEVAAAQADATTNGFTAGTVGNVITTVTIGAPGSGPFQNIAGAVEVDIKQTQPSFLLAAVGIKTVTVTASATASPSGQPACIYALNPSASGAIQIVGNQTISTACGMLDNSSSSSAFSATGNITATGTQIGVVGNYSFTGNINVSPTPITGMASVSDPLASLPEPSVGSCTYTNYSQTGNLNLTISQGVYCGGITLVGNVNLILNPGTYIINGGGISVTGNSTITGAGVFIYLTGTSSTYKGVTITGNDQTTLSAPTSGTYAGILFFQDRTISSATASANPNNLTGNASSLYEGTLYFPTTEIEYTGNSSSTYTILVAYTIDFTGNATIGNNYSSLANGSPITAANPLSPVSLGM